MSGLCCPFCGQGTEVLKATKISARVTERVRRCIPEEQLDTPHVFTTQEIPAVKEDLDAG